MKALYQCAKKIGTCSKKCVKIAKNLQHNVRPLFGLGLLYFYSKVWMYLTCHQQQKPDNKLHLLCKLLHGGGTYHIETSPFISRANLWTDFSMIETAVMKELNQNVFYWFEKQEGNDKFLKSTLTISDKYWHSVNIFYCKNYARGVFRTQPNIYNKAF